MGRSRGPMADAARDAEVVLHAGSIVERGPTPGPEGKSLWNTSLVFGRDGSELARYRKIHRFGFATGEPDLMEAGDEGDRRRPAARAGRDGVPVGLSTCYDLRFPELYRRQLDLGATLLLVPAAWPAARVAHWSLFARARAVEEQCLVVACNTAGTHSGVMMGGRSVVVLPTGEVVAEAGSDDEEVLSVEVDLDVVERTRASFPVLADRRLRLA
jgi:predicted amidohydrolase